MCGDFLRRRSCVFFLSSCSGGVGYCCASSGVASLPLPAAPVVFHGVSCRRLPFGGSATFLAPVACPAPAVELCCWVCGVFGAPLGFLPCAVIFLRGLRFVQVALVGFSAFSVTGCLTYCCAGGVGWVATLPLYYLCFSCADWLAGVRWVLHPVSGSSLWVVSALWATVS